jgi:spoIIIJ-associated protein
MTFSLEFEAKNVEKAVEKACAELNIPKDEICYDVLSPGSSGIFGLAGAKKARIRVNLPETPESERDIPGKNEISEELAGNSSSTQKNVMDVVEPEMTTPNFFPENPLDLARTVLQYIVDSITTEATISATEDSEKIILKVVGGNSAKLIGKKGQTLEAIQSLVEKIVNKRNHHNHKIRVQVDIEGYLETRKANLENLATRLAEKARRSNKPISLGEMSAHDRRIVHLALKDHPQVRTQSRGEGAVKKLIILPKRNPASRSDRP